MINLKKIIVAVDHGNYFVKGQEIKYRSGFTVSASKPIVEENLLRYKDNYYGIGDKRCFVQTDKTENDNFFILTLPIIAEEMDKCNLNEADIVLACGLSLLNYGEQYKSFKEYFIRNNIQFSYNNKNYNINIVDVEVFPQGLAGIMTSFAKYKSIESLAIIDIGGFTTDIVYLNDGNPIRNKCFAVPIGCIHIVSEIKAVLERRGKFLEEFQIENLIKGSSTISASDDLYIDIIEVTERFVDDLLKNVREKGIDLNYSKLIFIGGGAALLKEYIMESKLIDNATVLEDSEYLNARGYYKLAKQIVESR